MTDAYITADTIRLLIPEILLVGLAIGMYMSSVLVAPRRGWLVAVALCGLAVVAGALYVQDVPSLASTPETPTRSGPLIVDYFGHALRWAALLTGVLLVLAAARSGSQRLAAEYLGSLLLVVAGTMVVCTAGDLVLLFLGLELISIPIYVLLFLGRRDSGGQEATVKYFFLNILSSGLLLYGLSLLYGATGTLVLEQMPAALAAGNATSATVGMLAPLAVVLSLAGLGFKMAAVPFHFYAPDVYQGTSNGNAGLLAVAPKLAGLIALIRLLVVTTPQEQPILWQITLLVAVLSMLLGNVVALWQQNVRRLMAYSSIAHTGYLFIGLSVALAGPGEMRRNDGVAAALFYLLVYVLATLGTFAALAYLGREGKQIDGVDELAGIGKTHPLIAAALAVFMFSLTGIPPLAGFWGKLVLFANALAVAAEDPGGGLRPWFVGLAVVGAISAAISAGYYLRVVGIMYFRGSANVPPASGGYGAGVATLASALLVIVVGLMPGRLMVEMNRAGQAVRHFAVRHDRQVTAKLPAARMDKAADRSIWSGEWPVGRSQSSACEQRCLTP